VEGGWVVDDDQITRLQLQAQVEVWVIGNGSHSPAGLPTGGR
jgi:hypothetical protein